MNHKDVIEKIKTKGYWRINFEPLSLKEQLEPLSKCKEIVEKNGVHLRGWDYPHLPRRIGEDTALEPGDNFWQGWLDWEGETHKEFWRMYQSSQFIHYLALREDWIDDLKIKSMWLSEEKTLPEGGVIGVISTTYQITEIFEFLSRLIQDGLYKDGVRVKITLFNTQGRHLIVDGYSRIQFSTPKPTSTNSIKFEKVYAKNELETSARDKAFEAILHFFERFGWDEPNTEVIKSDQENFLAGKI